MSRVQITRGSVQARWQWWMIVGCFFSFPIEKKMAGAITAHSAFWRSSREAYTVTAPPRRKVLHLSRFKVTPAGYRPAVVALKPRSLPSPFCRFRKRSSCHRFSLSDQMDSVTTPAAKGRPPFRPPGGPNLGTLPPLSDFQSFLEEHKRFYESARKTHRAVVASTADAAAGRHLGCLEPQDGFDTWKTPRQGPKGDREVAVARRRRQVTATSTPCLRDGVAVKSEGSVAFARSLSGKKTTKKTFQEVVSGSTTKTGGKRRSEAEVGVKDETPNPKTPRLEFEQLQAAEPVDACEVGAALGAHVPGNFKNSGVRQATVPSQAHHAASVNDAWVVDPKTVLVKSRPSALANVPSGMTSVDRHRRCFEPKSCPDWPQRSTASMKRRNKKAQSAKIAIVGPTREKRCARKINFACPAPDTAETSSAHHVPSMTIAARMVGVGGFLKSAFMFVISILVPRAWRLLAGRFR
ncbi:uncharacterized protein LOC119164132 isoform X5 [Rhipicephalus microplus]|uniref:uncharacterized protein LOC119164132 isoform X5 n=1 Tax=Rhipicephalus microplus TaxID=6941 RepID=UPI003F6A6823